MNFQTFLNFKKNAHSLHSTPEILYEIFSYLSPYYLKTNVAPVCRLYFNVASSIIEATPFVWCENLSSNKVLSRIRDTQELIIPYPSTKTGHIREIGSHHPQWAVLTDQIRKLSDSNILRISRLNISRPLRVDTWLVPLISWTGPRLTSLKLQNMTHREIPLVRILTLCPRLEVLHMHHTNLGYIDSLQRYDSESKYEPVELPKSSMLKSLKLDLISIGGIILFKLLESASRLEELYLMRIYGGRDLQDTTIDPSLLELDNLNIHSIAVLNRISCKCPKLKSVHFSSGIGSLAWGNEPQELLDLKFSLFPEVMSWSFLGHHLGCPSFISLRSFRDTLTTLEIINSDFIGFLGNDSNTISRYQEFLQLYLCESPHLLHLKAPKTILSTSCMDLEGILLDAKFNNNDMLKIIRKYSINLIHVRPPYYRKVWACSNLRTLHLGFDRESGGYNENLRVIFGYIGKVCPRLQDLRILYPFMCLSMEEGLCLLTRLPKLQSLAISTGYSDFNPWNIDWASLCTPPWLRIKLSLWMMGQNISHKVVSAIYPSNQTTEDRSLDDMEGTNTTTEMDDVIPSYMISGIDMRNLGRIEDINSLFRERLNSNQLCWPDLEQFELDITNRDISKEAIGQFKEAFRRLRPDLIIK